MFEDFHFLRPWWFLLILAIPLSVYIYHTVGDTLNRWRAVIDDDLADKLLKKPKAFLTYGGSWVMAAALLLTTVALAGPTWEEIEQPVHKRDDALVIVLDLSYSMLAEDLNPSRVDRAKQKVHDILNNRKEGFSTIVAYAGDPHIVAPLTDDTVTLKNLLRSLDPLMMPIPGSDTASAIALAVDILSNATGRRGQILLLTDGVDRVSSIIQAMDDRYPLSIIGIGTESGAAIPIPTQSEDVTYLRDNTGRIINVRLDVELLSNLASTLNGSYRTISIDDRDIEMLSTGVGLNSDVVTVDKTFDSWHDMGYWLILPIALLAMPGLRRGALLCFLAVIPVQMSHASWWADLWQTPDQQAYQHLREGRADLAKARFDSTDWQGVADYRVGEFEAAAQAFADSELPQARYNLGNALAKAGELEEALGAYESFLRDHPKHEDALFNRDLVQRLLDEHQQQQSGESQHESQNQDNPDSRQGQQNEQNASGDPEVADQDQSATEPKQNGDPPQSQPQQLVEESSKQDEGQAGNSNLKLEERELQDTLDRWLRRIPDDPGGLLRQKFQYETTKRIREGQDLDEPRSSKIW